MQKFIMWVQENLLFETYPHSGMEAQIIDLLRAGKEVDHNSKETKTALYSLRSKGIVSNNGTRNEPVWKLN